MSYSMKRAVGGFRAVAACDHTGGCAARIERVKRTEAEAAVSLVYAMPAAGWNDDAFPRAIYCPAHAAKGAR